MARIFMPWTSPLLSLERLKSAFVIRAMDQLSSALLLSTAWQATLRTVQELLEAVPVVSGFVEVDAQGSAISTTNVPAPPRKNGTGLAEGTYRVSYYLRTVTPGGVSSSFQLTLGWTDGGVAQSMTSAALNGNTTTSVVQGSAYLHVDTDSAVTYAVTYASTPAGAEFSLFLDLEMLP